LVFFKASKSGIGSYTLLLAEFLIIVVGFFVSLQVNEWQNSRENRELESQYLLRLENDLENSRSALEKNIDQMRSSIERMEDGLTILSNEKRDADDYQRLFDALQSSSIMGSFAVSFGTFEELKDTGNMRLIESSRLRESLGNVWQQYLQVSKFIEIRNMLRGNTFPVMSKYVKPQKGNKLTFDSQLVEQDPREIYVAMSILRTNLRNDLTDSEKILTLVNQTLGIIRDEVEVRK
jgi:hypothetical protein